MKDCALIMRNTTNYILGGNNEKANNYAAASGTLIRNGVC
jgi:hypothetical protein